MWYTVTGTAAVKRLDRHDEKREVKEMTHEEFQAAIDYWKEKDAGSVKMERAKLVEAVDAYIRSKNTGALATGAGDFVRCTPLEYSYHDGAFWIFSEGGEKFIALEKNDNVCLAIFDGYGAPGGLHGMQVMGKAEMVEPFSEAYMAHAAYRKVPAELLKKQSPPMNLIRIRPTRIDYLCSEFKKAGCSSRQSLVLEE